MKLENSVNFDLGERFDVFVDDEGEAAEVYPHYKGNFTLCDEGMLLEARKCFRKSQANRGIVRLIELQLDEIPVGKGRWLVTWNFVPGAKSAYC